MFHRNINNISSIIEIVDKEYENCKKIIRESGVCITEYDNISTIKLRSSSVGIELIILIINEILQNNNVTYKIIRSNKLELLLDTDNRKYILKSIIRDFENQFLIEEIMRIRKY